MSGVRTERPGLILAVCCMSLFIVGLDVSALNLALPSIRADLDAGPEQLQWILDAYTIVLAGLLMLSGSLADRFGRRRVFRIGLTVFGIGSVLCAFSTTGEALIAARALQAVGGSMLNPVAMSIIVATFHDPAARARAIGVWGAASGLSMALGPLFGGVLVEAFSWEAVFWMNVPVVVLALVLTGFVIPESRAENPRSLDPVGQGLVVVALVGVTYALIEGRGAGWTSAEVLTALGAAVLAAIAFVLVERRLREPLIDPHLFRSPPFTGAILAAISGFACLGGFLFVTALYLQVGRGYSPIMAGVMTLPMAALNVITAPLSGRMVAARGPKTPMLVSGVAMGASALILTTLTDTTPVPVLVVAYALFGLGFGLLNAPITNAAVSGMPRSRAGVASGVASASRQVGSALGVALLGTLAFGAVTTGADSAGADLGAGTHPAWWAMAVCSAAVVAIAFVVSRPASPPPPPRPGVPRGSSASPAAPPAGSPR